MHLNILNDTLHKKSNLTLKHSIAENLETLYLTLILIYYDTFN